MNETCNAFYKGHESTVH